MPRKIARGMRRLKPVRPNQKLAVEYARSLLAIVKKVRSDVARVLDTVGRDYSIADGSLRDAKSKPNLKPLDKLANEWAGLQGQAKKIAKNVAYKALAQVDDQVAGMIKSTIAVDVSPLLKRDTRIGKEVDACIQWNVELIQDVPAKFIDDVRDFVEENWSSGRRWEELVDEIDTRLGGNAESRAKLIARDQTAKMNGTLNRVRQQNLGIDQYEWSASNDERTRPMHANLDGKIFSWDRPPVTNEEGDENHPGEDFNCLVRSEMISTDTRINRVYRRRYTGRLVTIRTASAHLSATPNHPLWTDQGWKAIGDIGVGDRVAYRKSDSAQPIGEVFDATADPVRVRMREGAFHGDASAGPLDVGTLAFACETREIEPQFEDVLDVAVTAHDDYVYNVETACGWYRANGIAVKNCRCVAIPVINPQDLETDLQGELFGEDKDASDD